jgi:hypothetical protein
MPLVVLAPPDLPEHEDHRNHDGVEGLRIDLRPQERPSRSLPLQSVTSYTGVRHGD